MLFHGLSRPWYLCLGVLFIMVSDLRNSSVRKLLSVYYKYFQPLFLSNFPIGPFISKRTLFSCFNLLYDQMTKLNMEHANTELYFHRNRSGLLFPFDLHVLCRSVRTNVNSYPFWSIPTISVNSYSCQVNYSYSYFFKSIFLY